MHAIDLFDLSSILDHEVDTRGKKCVLLIYDLIFKILYIYQKYCETE